jgi:hypothetical protein
MHTLDADRYRAWSPCLLTALYNYQFVTIHAIELLQSPADLGTK